MFGIGFPEMVLVLIIAYIVLGPEKLPEIARMLGKALNEIRRATEEVRGSIQKEADQVQRELKEGEKGGDAEGEKSGRG